MAALAAVAGNGSDYSSQSMTSAAASHRPGSNQNQNLNQVPSRQMSGMPPVVSSPVNIPVSSPMTRTTNYPPVSSMGSLASILGAPRMSGPGFRPGMPQPPPHSLRPSSSGSPLMRMTGPRGPPMAPSGSLNMPSLHPRPPSGPLSFPPLQVPAGAGPVSEQLNRVATKLVDFMRGSLEELFRELASQGSPEATIKALQVLMLLMLFCAFNICFSYMNTVKNQECRFNVALFYVFLLIKLFNAI